MHYATARSVSHARRHGAAALVACIAIFAALLAPAGPRPARAQAPAEAPAAPALHMPVSLVEPGAAPVAPAAPAPAALAAPAALSDTPQTGPVFSVNEVTDTNDGMCGESECSFREAIAAVNAAGPGGTIIFDLMPPAQVTFANTLFLNVGQTVINGDIDNNGTPDVLLRGRTGYQGLVITSANNTVKNLAFTSLVLDGAGARGNTITNSYIGTDVEGLRAYPNEGNGVAITDGAADNVISNNIIAGNTTAAANNIKWSGVYLHRAGAGNRIEGNRIGFNRSSQALPNDLGITISGGTKGTIVGGDRGDTTACEGVCNLIGASNFNGVLLLDADTSGNIVAGNYIGVDRSGVQRVGTGNDYGVVLRAGATDNTIGTTTRPGTACSHGCNLISGNANYGVALLDAGVTGNTIAGNYIGAGADGTEQGNGSAGVLISTGPSANTIGGVRPGTACTHSCNLISGNGSAGVALQDANTADNRIHGNYIGVTADGAKALPNTGAGVVLVDGPQRNQIGGNREGQPCTGACNVISGNRGPGLDIEGVGTNENVVAGNYIGVAIDSTTPVPNTASGIEVFGGAQDTLIGGRQFGELCAGPCNVIGGNLKTGVLVGANADGVAATGTRIQGNVIGGFADLIGAANGASGVAVIDGAANTTIGGAGATTMVCEGVCNRIVTNKGDGVTVRGETTAGATIRGNAIIGNAVMGIDLGDDGVTLNDTGDADSGPNTLVNAPLSLAASFDGTRTTISGVITPVEGPQPTIEIFASDIMDPTGTSQGQKFLGVATFTSATEFKLTISGDLPLPQLSATATDAAGNTSEFSTRTPLIFIPGAGGSQLMRGKDEIWFNAFGDRRLLSLRAGDSPASSVSAATFLRGVGPVDVYGVFEAQLRLATGYREYDSFFKPEARTAAGCDLSQRAKAPSLFIFPYDWRLPNEDNAARLKDYIGCVQQFYPGAKVTLLTHSMGGLLARRYLLDNSIDHQVGRLVTLAAPWLGAPKMLHVMEGGKFAALTSGPDVAYSAQSMPAAHQLMPSRAYYAQGALPPFVEKGWDFDGDGRREEVYDTYSKLVAAIDHHYPAFTPGQTNSRFHTADQDDWRNDPLGVSYVHIYTTQAESQTIGQVAARTYKPCTEGWNCTTKEPVQVSKLVPGDGTVPLVSLRRTGLNDAAAEVIAFASPGKDQDGAYEHGEMVKLPEVLRTLVNRLSYGCSGAALTRCPGIFKSAELAPQTAPLAAEAAPATYQVILSGGQGVAVISPQGESTATGEGDLRRTLNGVLEEYIGDGMWQVIAPGAGGYRVTFRTGAEPLLLDVTLGDEAATTHAARYHDLTLPAGVTATLTLDPLGAVELRYDANGDGTPDTTVEPTARVSGAQAADLAGPEIMVLTNPADGSQVTVTLDVSDPSGVKQVLYSFDGVHFQPYTRPFTADKAATPTVHVIADDALANREVLSQDLSGAPASRHTVFLSLIRR